MNVRLRSRIDETGFADTFIEDPEASAPLSRPRPVTKDEEGGDRELPNYLASLFDSPRHLFEAGKLGMWLFLAAEAIYYSGLFCAYAVMRNHRPEVFEWGRHFVDRRLGTASTIIMLVSSLTAGHALRYAQLGQRRRLNLAIGATLTCGVAFLGIKVTEFSAKSDQGLLPGKYFGPQVHVWEVPEFKRQHPVSSVFAERLYARAYANTSTGSSRFAATLNQRPTVGQLGPLVRAGVLGPVAVLEDLPSQPRNAQVFFGLFFLMTGLHFLHVLAGIGTWIWLLLKSRSGSIGPNSFGSVNCVALHWHLVDVAWLYLFPLFYLIQ